MNRRTLKSILVVTLAALAVALSLADPPRAFAGGASGAPGVMSGGAGTGSAESGADSAVASANIFKIDPTKIYTHPIEVLPELSKREVELYREYFEELLSSVKEHRMPKVKDAFIEELFKNTFLIMLYVTFSLKVGPPAM